MDKKSNTWLFPVLSDQHYIEWCTLRAVHSWSKSAIVASSISAAAFVKNARMHSETRRVMLQLDYCPAATDDYRLQSHVVVVVFKPTATYVYDNVDSFEVKGDERQPDHAGSAVFVYLDGPSGGVTNDYCKKLLLMLH